MSRKRGPTEEQETTRVFVSNLLRGKSASTEEEVREFFSQIGEVTDVTVPKGRGMAFVGFRTKEEAKSAIFKLDRAYLGNRRLSIRPALPLGGQSSKEESRTSQIHPPPAKKRAKDPSQRKPTKRDEFFELMTGKPRLAEEVAEEEDYNGAADDKDLDDLAYLRTKTVGVEVPVVEKALKEAAEEEERTGRLLVHNIACEEDNLLEVFGAYGTISEVHAPIDKQSKKQLGYAFVRFVLPEDAERARLALDGKPLYGKTLRVVEAMDQPQRDDNYTDEKQSRPPRTFSEKRQAERRAAAGKTPSKTGMLNEYVREDAIFATAAKRAGVDKKQALFNAYDSGGAAVTMALAEASLQAETRDYFLSKGYDLTDDRAPRSRQALLLKNLPSDTKESELGTLFGADLSQLFLAPAKTTAIAVFGHPTQARAALKRHAYRRFRRIPLYLDWAPLPHQGLEEKVRIDAEKADAMLETQSTTIHQEEATATLYLKNLAFSSTAAGLEALFADCQGFRAVTVPPAASDDTKKNRGFAFVSFATAEDAAAALRRRRGQVLDDRVLDLHFAASDSTPNDTDADTQSKIPSAAELKRRGKNPTKLVVRNLAFAATAHDLRSLFSALGQISTVRLPKRFDGRHRGFAFVDFASYRDATAALTALKAAHLFGRHLVLDFADASVQPGQDDEVLLD